jgi:hypothetical protein
MEPYRVFISYAHEDRQLARGIFTVLKNNGLAPLWDHNLSVGRGFDQQIQTFIAHAHVFLPIITPSSSARGWVHQEIGYAMALHVPVLPVCNGQLPGEMLQMLHGVTLESDAQDLSAQLAPAVFDMLVRRAEKDFPPLFACAVLPDERARMLADYALKVREMDAYGHVRQKGGLTAFNIPNKSLGNSVWKERYGSGYRSEDHCRLILGERRALEEHAREKGCSLIVDLTIDYSALGPSVRGVRLRSLIAFLESMPDNKVKVVFHRPPSPHSLTIVGDWFMAESISADINKGYRHTVFTRHAPSIRDRIEGFDQEFEELLQEPENEACSTRVGVIRALEALLFKEAKPSLHSQQ